jgi:glycosyltransferase involved in cell wall biosynthesis
MSGLNISVAMCTFNGERFLSAQLESIAAQDRVPDELVVCDDGSSDGSREIIREFARRSTFSTRFLSNDRNLGSTKNFERAISLCRGAIVALADQDDVWYPHKLRRIENAFLRSSAIVAAFSDADLIDDNSRLLGFRLWPTFSFDIAKQKQFANGHALNVLIRHPVVTGATMAFRRELFDLIAPIPADEFHDRWISFLLAARGRFETISESLLQYRRHDEQQLGPGPLTLRGQMAQAKSRGKNSYLDDINRFQQLYDRLSQHRADFPNAEYAQKQIRRKICHFEHRARLPDTKAARIPKVFREVFNGNYWRYSGGWKSIASDLVFR